MPNPTGKGGFKPGQSGNPNGRKPKAATVRASNYATILERLREMAGSAATDAEGEDAPDNPGRAAKMFELCRGFGPEALARLVDEMETGATSKDRSYAAQILLERGWGKAQAQQVIDQMTNNGPTPLDLAPDIYWEGKKRDAALRERLSGLRERAIAGADLRRRAEELLQEFEAEAAKEAEDKRTNSAVH